MLSFKLFLTEKLKTENDDDINTTNYLKHSGIYSAIGKTSIEKDARGKRITDKSKLTEEGYDAIHNHSAISTHHLAKTDKNVIKDFTTNSNIANDFLQKKYSGEYTDDDPNTESHIQKLSSLFTPKNTNKEHIISFSGIPANVGKKLLNSQKGSKHILPRFTSTTTNYNTGLYFAHKHSILSNHNASKLSPLDVVKYFANRIKPTPLHVIKFHNEPGTTLSAAPHSKYPYENELMINHGANITYLHSEKKEQYLPALKQNRTVYVHNVITHNIHTPIQDYKKEKGMSLK